MKRLEVTLTIVLAVCAVIITGLVIRRELGGPPKGNLPQPPSTVDNWASFGSVGSETGAAQGSVRVLEFSDFQCPFCKRLSKSLDSIRAKYPTQVSLVYRHFPIERIHPHARSAAFAAECAAEQGKFREVHDFLYENQGAIGTLSWTQIASKGNVPDTVRFNVCMRDSVPKRRVDLDIAMAKKLGLIGTPTVMVNQWRFHGTPSLATLDSAIQSELRRSKAR